MGVSLRRLPFYTTAEVGGQTYNESPSLVLVLSPTNLALLTGTEPQSLIAVFVISVVEGFGQTFSETPSTVFVLLPSAADLQRFTFHETPTQTFVLVPAVVAGLNYSDIPGLVLSLLPQTGGERVLFQDTVVGQWNESGQVTFSNDESKPAWTWGGKITDIITYPAITKRELVASRTEVKS